MIETQYTLEKTGKGWQATTEIDLGPGFDESMKEHGRRTLRIRTDKGYRGGIESDAKVHLDTGRSEVHVFSFGHGQGDFSKTILSNNKRATEKAVAELHELALLQLNSIIETAKKHYGIEAEA